jgi:hypothetical protein
MGKQPVSAKAKGQGFYFSQPVSAENTIQSLCLNLRLPDIDGI